MKTSKKYNRSEIMKRAWQLFRIWKNRSFSACLCKAWSEAKEAQRAIEWLERRQAETKAQYEANMAKRWTMPAEENKYATMASYYENRAYSGD